MSWHGGKIISRLTHYLHIRFPGQEQTQALAHDRVAVRQDNVDSHPFSQGVCGAWREAKWQSRQRSGHLAGIMCVPKALYIKL